MNTGSFNPTEGATPGTTRISLYFHFSSLIIAKAVPSAPVPVVVFTATCGILTTLQVGIQESRDFAQTCIRAFVRQHNPDCLTGIMRAAAANSDDAVTACRQVGLRTCFTLKILGL